MIINANTETSKYGLTFQVSSCNRVSSGVGLDLPTNLNKIFLKLSMRHIFVIVNIGTVTHFTSGLLRDVVQYLSCVGRT